MRSLTLFSLLLLLAACAHPERDNFAYVDPFIGTGGHGHTYPGAVAPFGMVQLSPDTRLSGWDGCSGYHYTDSLVYGFSHTHLSGTGVADYADLLLLPLTQAVAPGPEPGPAVLFDKKTETAEPGYYRAFLSEQEVAVELTATERTGLHRYTFPLDAPGYLLIDLMHRDEVLNSGLRIVSDREIEGFRLSRSWAEEQHVYFVIRFSRPFAMEAVHHPESGGLLDRKNYEGREVKALLRFAQSNEPLLVKVGISAVDAEGARGNLEAEAAGWDFDRVRRQTADRWRGVLDRIQVKGGSEAERTNFYTALYHLYLAPHLYQDVDGRYRGTDLAVHRAEDYTRYSVFSLWDTYRAAHPLFTILERERTNDFIRTFLAQYEEGGKLPMWELAGNYTGCMIGYHAVPVIADAYRKGIRDYDAALALEAMVAMAEADELGKRPYRELGFVPSEEEPESVSKTLEYAYDDWCIAEMAGWQGEEETRRTFLERAQSYRNLLDPESRLMRARVQQRWWQPFDPAEVNFHYTEANAWQYGFYVPQDIAGLARLHGGVDRLAARLDDLFNASSETTGREQVDITGLIGQYAHGNEPSHHLAYLYTYLGQAWKTQELARQILHEQYRPAPDGLSGNEDCGQMSAWYLLSAMGFYPVNPADGNFVFGSPLFESVTIHLENGQTFTVRAEGQSPDHPYIQAVKRNDAPYGLTYITYEEIMQGGALTFVLGPDPNPDWGADPATWPPSAVTEHQIVPAPAVSRGGRAFFGQDTIVLNCIEPAARLFYTLDGSEPDQEAPEQAYAGPFVIDKTTVLRAVAVLPDGTSSRVIQTSFYRIPMERGIELATAYAPHYAAGGDHALIDYQLGGSDFRTGDWQGYHGVDLDATVDLGSVQPIEKVALRCLQDENAWIFMPLEVRFWLSEDGKTFREAGTVINPVSPRDRGAILHTFEVRPGARARYLRVQAVNRGVCPDWHKGAGGKAWVFADEILVNDELAGDGRGK